MELGQFILIVKKRKKVLFFAVLLFLAIAAAITLRSPLEYRAGARLLIVQNYGAAAPLDPYVVAQANTYLSGVLTQVVSSGAFYEQVIASDFNFDKEYFSGDAAVRSAKWRHTVEAFAAGDSGIIEVRAYHPDKYQAEQLVQAVVYTLKEKHALYHSSGGKVSLKVIDQPLVSAYPARPNLPLALASALLSGLAFGLFYIYLFSYPRELYLPHNQFAYQPALARDLPPSEPLIPESEYPLTQNQMQNNRPLPSGPEAAPQAELMPESPSRAIGRGDMRNVLGHKGL